MMKMEVAGGNFTSSNSTIDVTILGFSTISTIGRFPRCYCSELLSSFSLSKTCRICSCPPLPPSTRHHYFEGSVLVIVIIFHNSFGGPGGAFTCGIGLLINPFPKGQCSRTGRNATGWVWQKSIKWNTETVGNFSSSPRIADLINIGDDVNINHSPSIIFQYRIALFLLW